MQALTAVGEIIQDYDRYWWLYYCQQLEMDLNNKAFKLFRNGWGDKDLNKICEFNELKALYNKFN